MKENYENNTMQSAQEFKYGIASKSKIPSIIWTYLDTEEIPENISILIEFMRKYNTQYELKILNRKNITSYLPEYFSEYAIQKEKVKRIHKLFVNSPQKKADFISLQVLKAYGGIWLDSTILLRAPLDWIHGTQKATNAEYVGYYIKRSTRTDMISKSPVIENWLMAAIPNSQFIKLWAEEFSRIAEYETVNDYIQSVIDVDRVDIQDIELPIYMTMQVGVQRIFQKQGYNLKTLLLYEADKGPIKYLLNTRDSITSIESLLKEKDNKYINKYPVIKLTKAAISVLNETHLKRLDQLL